MKAIDIDRDSRQKEREKGSDLIPVPEGELVKAGTCAHDRRALQQLALNVHVKHSDLT